MARMKRRAVPNQDRPKSVQPLIVVEKSAQTEDGAVEVNKSIGSIFKATEQKIAFGIVLQPGIVDAQGDIMTEETIAKAAHSFLARYNRTSKLGLQHKTFSKNFDLIESYVTLADMVVGRKTIKKGSWVMAVKCKSDKIWKKIKSGKITGFSIAGRAKGKKIAA